MHCLIVQLHIKSASQSTPERVQTCVLYGVMYVFTRVLCRFEALVVNSNIFLCHLTLHLNISKTDIVLFTLSSTTII